MKLDQAREVLKSSALLGQSDPTYTDTRLDYVIHAAMTWACRYIQSPVTFSEEIDTVDGTYRVDLSTALSLADSDYPAFEQWQLLDIHIGFDLVQARPLKELQAALGDNSSSEAQPELFAWLDTSHIHLHPVPDDAYTLLIRCIEPVKNWTWGTATPENVTLNQNDMAMYPILWYLAASLLRHREPKQAFESRAWQRGMQELYELRGQLNQNAAKSVAHVRDPYH